MKKILTFALLLMGAAVLRAQEPVKEIHDEDSDIRGRVAAEVDWKAFKGFHIYASEELRLDENFSHVDRLHGTLGASYKINSHLKTELEYNPIVDFKTGKADQWRHRIAYGLTGNLKWSQFKFSLREKIQVTRKMDDKNPYQEPKWKAALRSRLKVSYDFHTRWEPYMSVELRHYLNSPDWTWDAAGNTVYGGYSDAYMDRVRAEAGVEYAFSKDHRLEIYVMYDRCYEKEYDSKRKKPVLKTVWFHTGNYLTLGLAYKFKL